MKEPHLVRRHISNLDTYNIRRYISNFIFVVAFLALAATAISFGVLGLGHVFIISGVTTALLFVACFAVAPDLPC